MAISIALLSSGLSLLTMILEKVWKAESAGGKTGEEKHAYVKGFIAAYLRENDLKIENMDKFIKEVIALLNKYKIFSKEV